MPKKMKPTSDAGNDGQPEAAPRAWPASWHVVGIGASAGGLEALQEFFGHLPVSTGLSFVVVTHVNPDHPSLLPELLGRITAVPVAEARDGMRLEPDHAYVAPAGGLLSVVDGTLFRTDPEAKESPRNPIDFFFQSLARDQQGRAGAIVLSGTGSDGTLGVQAIKEMGGIVFVQQPQSAKYAGMPSSAVASGAADAILPPGDMPVQLVELCHARRRKQPEGGGGPEAGTTAIPAEPLRRMCALLYRQTGHDFSGYKGSTMRRRIVRRMVVHQISDVEQYVRYLQENAHEVNLLFKELLISVTGFFRDAEAWEELAGDPLQGLIASCPERHCLRIWVPGCATGEEVYSIAILVRETMRRLNRQLDVQIFGTDLDPKAIEVARAGRYPGSITSVVSAERLERYFVDEEGRFRIRGKVRDMTIFAVQNLVKDPPFTKLDLIGCRNVLIYLDAGLQKKLLPLFHYALKPGGLLFLGPSETIGPFTDCFDTVSRQWKLFRRKESATAGSTLPDFHSGRRGRGDGGEGDPLSAAASLREPHFAHLIERVLLARFAPTCVIVTERGDIAYIHGRAGAYLEPTSGRPRHNILEMARDGLQIELVSALREAVATDAAVLHEAVRFTSNGELMEIDLGVAKITEPEALRGLYIVSFRPGSSPSQQQGESGKKRRRPRGVNGDRVKLLERELMYTRESLQTTVEELETSNEELKSSNEELQSTNEELQSTNEELETSKEELQSMNEELTTVNAELQCKVGELTRTNNDMQNLLNSTDIATLFLDNGLNILRFTAQASKLIHLIKSDIGRPISDLASKLQLDDLSARCRDVLRTLAFTETEVRTSDGLWYLMRISPYRTTDNVVAGLVLTFVNIDEVKRIRSQAKRT